MTINFEKENPVQLFLKAMYLFIKYIRTGEYEVRMISYGILEDGKLVRGCFASPYMYEAVKQRDGISKKLSGHFVDVILGYDDFYEYKTHTILDDLRVGFTSRAINTYRDRLGLKHIKTHSFKKQIYGNSKVYWYLSMFLFVLPTLCFYTLISKIQSKFKFK